MDVAGVVSIVIASVTAVGLVATNVVYFRQAREMTEQNAKLSSQLSLIASDTMRNAFEEVGRAWLTYPQLRKLFYEDERGSFDVTKLTSDDLERARAIAENMLDAFETAIALDDDALLSLHTYGRYFETMIRGSFLRNFLEEHADWYSPKLLEAASRAVV